MSPRTLSILNAIGCLALTGLVVVQWRKERSMTGELTQSKASLALSLQQTDEEVKRAIALERDISVLKESIEATRQAAESSARALAEKNLLAARLENELSATREQVSAWEAAVKQRDERIRSLDADLSATRKLLDQAIAKLKAAGAR